MKIIRVSNMAGPTSAPFNTFSIFRLKNNKDEICSYVCLRPIDKSFLAKVDSFGGRLRITTARNSLAKFIKALLTERFDSPDSSLVHCHQPGVGFLAFILFRLTRAKFSYIYNVHNEKQNFPFHKLILVYLCFALADKVVFVSSGAHDSFKHSFWLLGRSKFGVILNGVDLKRTEYASSMREDNCSKKHPMNTDDVDRPYEFVCIGRLVDQKNLHFLIRSVALLDVKFTLHVYGVGHHLESLKLLASDLGLASNVKFHGNVSREQVFEALGHADLYLSAAVYEGLPMALMEALSIGTPCLVSDIKSHREVSSLVSELKLAPLETTLFCAEILSILRNLPCYSSSRHDIARSLSMASMQNKYSNIYKTLMDDRVLC